MDSEIDAGSRTGRRYRTMEEKRRIVEATLGSSASMASLARQYGLNANQLFHWRKLYRAGLLGSTSTVRSDSSARLLPVTVEADPEQAESDAGAEQASGTINIELPGRVLISVEGRVDPSMVRAVLESLRG
jgi:transposase